MDVYCRRKYKTYRDLYIDKLLSPESADVDKLDEYEMDMNIESIVLARKEAEKEVRPIIVWVCRVCIDYQIVHWLASNALTSR